MIEIFCNKYKIDNYLINDDGSIDVFGNVILSKSEMNSIPIKFKNVYGWFDCSHNNLTNLHNSPDYCESFSCSGNNLKDLTYGPSKILNYYYCSNNPLQSLLGIPNNIKYLNIFPPKKFSREYILENLEFIKKATERNNKFKKILNIS